MKIAIWIARIGLAVMFLYAGFVKSGASEGFARTISQFTILPPSLVELFSLTLPWIEVLCGILLLIPKSARIGAVLAAVLLMTFIVAIGWALSQGLIVDCGCFGEDVPPSRERMVATLVRDAVLLVLTLGLALRRAR